MLSWNLFHGRAVPAASRELSSEFAAAIASWDWDLALLQEVPPWWAPLLASRPGAHQVTALTSRNAALPVRRALARRHPDLLRSNGGGANVVLARAPIGTARVVMLRRWPERRVGQVVQLAATFALEVGDARPLHVANVHASARVELAQAEIAQLGRVALAWAGEDPLVLGGDLNLRDHELAATSLEKAGFVHAASRDVDHIFARGLRAAGAEVLDSAPLSDHPPLRARLERGPAATTVETSA